MVKRILIFSLAYYPKHVGGAEVAIKEITDRLPASEYEFHLICNRYDSTLPKSERLGNVVVHRIGFATTNPTMGDLRKFPLHLNKLLYQFLAFTKAKKLHEQYQFGAVWAMMAHATGVPAAKFKRAFPEIPYVLTLQEGDPPEEIEARMRWFRRDFEAAFVYADTIQVISNFLGAWAKRKGFKNEPVLIPNAVNTKHFSQTFSEAEMQAVQEALNKGAADTFLVTTSRLVHKNAVDDVIRALVRLPDNVHFVIFGTGPDEASLRKLAGELGIAQRVQFRGQLAHTDMPKYLKACDIFIRPSRSEGMGNSFVEAMAARLPVIATQEGGISDFLFDEKRNPDKPTTGWAVPKDSPEDIAAAVRDIMARHDKVAEVTQTAYEMVVRAYDWDKIATDMHTQVFDRLLPPQS